MTSDGGEPAREFDDRPWGSYEVLDEAPGSKVKRIEVRPGHRLSLQSHEHRAEHWVVVAGRAVATLGSDEIFLHPGEHMHIPRGARHRLANPDDETLVLVEVQTGSYLAEDDIIRYEDDYSRT
jgi:mannose-6-phosphate isomerase-like protein (cupin superfamily)